MMSQPGEFDDNSEINAILLKEVVPTLNNTTDLKTIMTAVYNHSLVNSIIIGDVHGQLSKGRELKSSTRGKDALKKAKIAIVRNSDDKKQIYKLLSFARRHCFPHDEIVAKLLSEHNPYTTPPSTAPGLASNPDFPYISKKLSVIYAKASGSRVVCNSAVRQGEVVMVEPAFQFILKPGQEMYFCDACCKRISSFFPCHVCSEVVYCSERCRDNVSSIHDYECGYIAMFTRVGHASRLLMKILLSTTRQPGLHAPSTSQQLRYNKNKSTYDLCKISSYCLCLLHYLVIATDYFGKNATDEEKIAVATTMLLLQLQIIAHIQGIYSYYASWDPDCELNVRTTCKHHIGVGVFTSSSLINHSCEPNVHYRFSGHKMVVVAREDMFEGDEIFHCYGPHFKFSCRENRQHFFFDKFGTNCSCLPCAQEKDYYEIFHSFRCPKCYGPAVAPPGSTTACCWECGDSLTVTEDMINILHDTKLEIKNGTWSLIEMINRWRELRKIYYHSHGGVVSLSHAIRERFIAAREWHYVFQVSEAAIAAMEYRYFFPCPELTREYRLTGQAALKAASQMGFESQQGASLMTHSFKFSDAAAKAQNSLCGLTEVELDLNPVFMDSQY